VSSIISIGVYSNWLNSLADCDLAPSRQTTQPMPNNPTPNRQKPDRADRPLILQFLEQLYELNNADALAAFLANPNPALPAEFADRAQTLQPHIDRAYQNAAHTQQLQTHLTQLQQISRPAPTIHLTETSFVSIGLTTRQSEILFRVAQGSTNEAIGQTLGIHSTTVKTHLTNIYPKLNVNSRLAAVATALKQLGINS
jgi:ATP/maltotriose-dependent transcriptional regulator MalT